MTCFLNFKIEISKHTFQKMHLLLSFAKCRTFSSDIYCVVVSLWLIKSPRITGGFIVICPFPPPPRHRRSANTFQLSRKTPEANFFKPHMVGLWVWENFLALISVTLGQGHWATEAGRNLSCPHDTMRTAHPIATKLDRYIPLIILSTWLNFGVILRKMLFRRFFNKILNPFSPVEHSICHILGMVGPIDVKQKEMSQLDATLIRVPLTLTFDLDR